MPCGHRDLQNSNLEYFGNKVTDLKMAITLVFLDLFKNFKSLKLSVFIDLIPDWVLTLKIMTETMLKLSKR